MLGSTPANTPRKRPLSEALQPVILLYWWLQVRWGYFRMTFGIKYSLPWHRERGRTKRRLGDEKLSPSVPPTEKNRVIQSQLVESTPWWESYPCLDLERGPGSGISRLFSRVRARSQKAKGRRETRLPLTFCYRK